MIYALYTVATIYAALCVVAPLLKVKQWKSCPSIPSMFTGGMCLFSALVLENNGYHNAWVLALMALLCISISAWKNGSNQGKINVSHHIIRTTISLIILLGFIVL